MTIYFEGDGKSRPVTISECRDQFISTLKDVRDEILNDPTLESYEDTPQRDRVIADRVIGGVLGVLDGNSDTFPAVNLITYIADGEVEEAKAAGANYLDHSEFADFGQGLQEYWNQVSN
ncbi:hypothetical protein ST201phi2-1p369 [Pseudomonas phage 201phi2-1]|uniref:Uncharacterized protein n=1 Tax=Pseudomonas phage 201phi2-1 TaxID=198110 RepID=B3FJM9_BP201|nr:hypothetical protein ST201phi2-1p369 [Pseudomonas phage 201phi2-1]ABY63194.1 hypothetical protein 201phi2-1p369 [Pseudomonas phage 201phi2-1]